MTEAHDDGAFEALWHELDALPKGQKGEIVAGRVRLLPRPGFPHARVRTKLAASLDGFDFDSADPGGWVVLVEPDLRLGDDLRCPDLAGWRVSRFVAPPGRGPFRVAPDWACEVLSPSTAKYDRGEKMPLYARHGVSHLWLIDPEAKSLEVYRREGELWLVLGTHADDARVRVEPFEALELELRRLWSMPG